MELKEQLTNYEQSKRIKELGFEKDSLYIHHSDGVIFPNTSFQRDFCKNYKHEPGFAYYPAYTVSELIEYLPRIIKDGGDCYHLQITKDGAIKNDNTYEIMYTDGMPLCIQYNNTLAIALGDMLIYLLNNGYIKGN